MTRNLTVQLVAVLIGLAALAGANALSPTIDEQRAELIDNTVVGVAPKHVLLAAGLGSFRGLAVDALWYRAEMLKREGKFFDAKTLRDWITTLQPRFPMVWSYQAWDMAYNISVQTQTPEERWDWVNKGIRILREEGIPNNPEAVRLYRELGWIFFHKVGQYSDDQHWFYKLQLAQEWQEVLGAPNEGATTEEVKAYFRPIADAAERYFGFNYPPMAARDALADLSQEYPDYAKEFQKASYLPLMRFEQRTQKLADRFRDDHPELAQRLDRLNALADQHLELVGQDPVNLLVADHPDVAPLIEQIGRLGLDLDTQALRRLGRLLMLIRYTDLELVTTRAAEFLDATDQKLLPLLIDPSNDAPMQALLSFLRAKALVQTYHMDPGTMYRLLDVFGPLDWRHPAAHGAYWSYLGVQRSGELRDRTKIDLLNTDRGVVHAMQSLFHFGRVNYDPIARRIDLLPDPRFADAYNIAMKDAIERQKQVTWDGGGNEESFAAGHENFLIKAVQYAYLYGDEEQARAYYDEVRDLYGAKPHNTHSGRYLVPLEDFVMAQLQEDWGMLNTARPFVEAALRHAFVQGLANGRNDVYNRYIRVARNMHEKYQKERTATTPIAERERLLMLPFPETLAETYAAFMLDQSVPIFSRARIYNNTPVELQLASYGRWRPRVSDEATRYQINFEALFPPPPGFEATPLLPEQRQSPVPENLERK